MDNLLLLTIFTIFATAFIGTIVKYRLRDRCLKEFRGYLVNVEFQDGRRYWGTLSVFHNGLELLYPAPHVDRRDGHRETSALVYQSQYGSVRALRRFHDELSPANQRRREREIRRSDHPNSFRRLARRTRNYVNLLRDAFGQAVSVFIGSFKRTGRSMILNTQDARITATAQQVIAQGASSYEPMLERYIGRRVVLELVQEGNLRRHTGILKEYSDGFLVVLDVPVTEDYRFDLSLSEQLRLNRDYGFALEPSSEDATQPSCVRLAFTNFSRRSVEVLRAVGEGYERRMDVAVGPGERVVLELGDPGCLPGRVTREDGGEDDEELASDGLVAGVQVEVRCRRTMDLIVPRSMGTIRHGGQVVGAEELKEVEA
ncbi:MAG TPA: hypothetical protein PKE55_10555 [Kiritimatiellia bacterium]|nr:hypothetical protein [Kiritimatiellia bacterium]